MSVITWVSNTYHSFPEVSNGNHQPIMKLVLVIQMTYKILVLKAGAENTAVKRGAHAQFLPKLLLNKVLNFQKFLLSSPNLRQTLKS